MIVEITHNRVCHECSEELSRALDKIAKKDRFVENILWASIFAIVKKLYFQTDESIIIITDSQTKNICTKVKLESVEKDNFFTAVKRVRDMFINKTISCQADVWIGKQELIRDETKSVFWVDNIEKFGKKQINWVSDEREEKSALRTYFMRIFVKAALFLLKNPDKKIKQLSECFEEDFQKICQCFNDTKRECSKHKSVFLAFVEQVNENGDEPALIYEEKKYTYRVLSEMVNCRIKRLQECGIKKDDVVGIFLDNKLEQIVSIMAILGCGAVYLPIEVTYPKERIQYMLDNSDAKYVIISDHFRHEKEIKEFFNKVKTIECTCNREDIWGSIADYEFIPNCEGFSGDDSAYIMYTSGSTGKPKGVEICHKSILRLVKNNGFLRINKEDRILQTSTIVFDASIIEVFGSLLNGACLVLSNKQDIIDPKRIKALIQNNEISIMWLSSPLFTQLSGQDSMMFQGVKHLMVGGDVLSPKHINLVRKCCKGIEIINGYGPTENTTFSTTYSIQKDFETSIPIGKPINNSSVYIMDSNHELLPIGAVGEICVGGDGVTKGYVKNDDFNKRKFINNPYGEGKLYLTGDSGFWTEDGIIEFIGRKDFQFKVNGFRVEMGEIETIALKCPGVINAAAVVEKIENQNKIVLVYSGQERENSVKQFLRVHLPIHMFPNYVLHMEIPLNENGKVNREIIRQHISDLKENRNVFEQLTEIEQAVSDVVNNISNLDYIKIDDNLFEMGFDSLKFAVLITHLNEVFQINLLFSEVYKSPSIRKISELASEKKSSVKRYVQRINAQDRYIASSAQKRVFFASNSDTDGKSYNVPALFRFNRIVDVGRVSDAWQQIINRHEALRTHFVIDDGELYQVIADSLEINIDTYECAQEDVKKQVDALISEFNLEKDILIRVNVIQTKEEMYMLVDIHHIIVDGFSMNIILSEFSKFFQGGSLQDSVFQNKDVIYSKLLLYFILMTRRN